MHFMFITTVRLVSSLRGYSAPSLANGHSYALGSLDLKADEHTCMSRACGPILGKTGTVDRQDRLRESCSWLRTNRLMVCVPSYLAPLLVSFLLSVTRWTAAEVATSCASLGGRVLSALSTKWVSLHLDPFSKTLENARCHGELAGSDDACEEGTWLSLWHSSTKRKRSAKMKRHKWKKRRKMLRQKAGKTYS